MRCTQMRFWKRWMDDAQLAYSGLRSERSKMRLRDSLLGAFLFCMAAHAFAYFNFAPMHDSLNHMASFAGTWEVSLGRFLLPTYGKLRGEYTMPWLSGMLSMLYIGIAAFLVNDLFEVDNRCLALMTAGFLSANATMISMMMAYPYVADAYTLALMIACAGAYAVIRMPNLAGALLGSSLFVVSMGLYQSYVLVGGLLMVLHAMLQATTDRHLFAHQVRHWLYYAVAVVLTVVIYCVMCKLFLRLYHIEIASSSSYNSPAKLKTMDLRSFPTMIWAEYVGFAKYFFGVHSTNITLMQKGDVALARRRRHCSYDEEYFKKVMLSIHA